jgi:hypothetical protein
MLWEVPQNQIESRQVTSSSPLDSFAHPGGVRLDLLRDGDRCSFCGRCFMELAPHFIELESCLVLSTPFRPIVVCTIRAYLWLCKTHVLFYIFSIPSNIYARAHMVEATFLFTR